MAKKSAKKQAPTGQSFEEALGELEGLVEAMENDQLPLEKLVAHYEKGAGLLQHCEQVLAEARKRIELIELNPTPENELAQEGSSVDDPQAPAEPTAGQDPQDDIRLL